MRNRVKAIAGRRRLRRRGTLPNLYGCCNPNLRENAMRGHHDMGGLPAGPVEPTEHNYAPWEKRVHALLTLLSHSSRGIIMVDELRIGIEALGAEEYDRLSYYERWIVSITNNLLKKGVISTDELGRKLAEIEAREAKGQ
ncbi:MAG: nitrile hydratase subunit beta [Gemmataceae bacterium]|nr:nitrile hydratase subunit beta [Gemmataceae bacterium]